jgi:hypothetical protein
VQVADFTGACVAQVTVRHAFGVTQSVAGAGEVALCGTDLRPPDCTTAGQGRWNADLQVSYYRPCQQAQLTGEFESVNGRNEQGHLSPIWETLHGDLLPRFAVLSLTLMCLGPSTPLSGKERWYADLKTVSVQRSLARGARKNPSLTEFLLPPLLCGAIYKTLIIDKNTDGFCEVRLS